jgi:rubrerythrin
MTNNPSGKLKAMFLMFKKAIEAERNAQSLYREIISVCEDKQLCGIFEEFHDDEVKHEKEITNQYKQMRKLYPDIDITPA